MTTAAYYAAHRKEIKAYNAAHYEAHKEELKASSAAYYRAHREECAARVRRYTETIAGITARFKAGMNQNAKRRGQ